MAKYVSLVHWTEKGIAGAKETTTRAEQAKALAKSLGGSMDLILWTIGKYDMVAICDFPDDETGTLFALKMGMAGSIRTQTMRAFTAEEMDGIIGKL